MITAGFCPDYARFKLIGVLVPSAFVSWVCSAALGYVLGTDLDAISSRVWRSSWRPNSEQRLPLVSKCTDRKSVAEITAELNDGRWVVGGNEVASPVALRSTIEDSSGELAVTVVAPRDTPRSIIMPVLKEAHRGGVTTVRIASWRPATLELALLPNVNGGHPCRHAVDMQLLLSRPWFTWAETVLLENDPKHSSRP